MVSERRSIHVEGYGHANPIPAACLIGNLLMSGVITGRDPDTGSMPSALEAQCAIVFRHVRRIVEAAGGTAQDIIKMNVWLRDPGDRTALNAEWLKLFPDAASRPARHTLPLAGGGDSLIQCDITAVVSGPSA